MVRKPLLSTRRRKRLMEKSTRIAKKDVRPFHYRNRVRFTKRLYTKCLATLNIFCTNGAVKRFVKTSSAYSPRFKKLQRAGFAKHLNQLDFFERYFFVNSAQRNLLSVVKEPMGTYFSGSDNPVLALLAGRINRELLARQTLGVGRMYLDAYKAKYGRAKPQPKHLPQKSNKKLNAVLAVFGDDQERKQSRSERRRDFFKTHQQKSNATARSKN